jgi:membrane-bound lytic murein transglycosylase B
MNLRGVFCAAVVGSVAVSAYADEAFVSFVEDLKVEARQLGLRSDIIDDAFGKQVQPVKRAVTKSKAQPEFSQTFNWYLSKMLSPARLQGGQTQLKTHTAELRAASGLYGVPAEVIVALWGVESHYGQYKGTFPILPSLATLAYSSHRKNFFRKEFFDALKIVQEGHVTIDSFTGSWAGAMGQCQFMPSSFLHYAKDGNGDGKKDIWGTHADIFASTAYYLKRNGWETGQPWGQRVVLRKILPALKLGKGKISGTMPLAYWKKLGIHPITGEKLPQDKTQARLFLPEGPSRKAYLLYENFDVIMRWNRSTAFAFSVLALADKISERAGDA